MRLVVHRSAVSGAPQPYDGLACSAVTCRARAVQSGDTEAWIWEKKLCRHIAGGKIVEKVVQANSGASWLASSTNAQFGCGWCCGSPLDGVRSRSLLGAVHQRREASKGCEAVL